MLRKNKGTGSSILTCRLGECLSFLLLTLAVTRGDSVPDCVNYQGMLTDASGEPLAPGRYSVELRIWSGAADAKTNALIWGAQYGVDVVNGSFSVSLGGVSEKDVKDPRDPTTAPKVTAIASAFGGSDRFLGLTIVTNGAQQPIPTAVEVVPRQQVVSTPYAIVSDDGVPIGGIVAWIPPQEVNTLEEAELLLPSGFRICRGASENRLNTAFNEERVPDLLGGRFLRGGAPEMVLTSGGTTHHNHSFSGRTARPIGGIAPNVMNWTDSPPNSGDTHTHAVSGTVASACHVPRHCSVLYVIRVH